MNPRSIPQLEARLAPRQRPARSPVGYQRWNELLFLHWDFEPATVQASLPPGLYVDTFEGRAYVGVVPFFMERIRPRFLPPVPGISWFLELNVRTYVFDEQGRPGVWFYSLDCNQALAVALARRFFHLPYFHASMSARRSPSAIRYSCQRSGAQAIAEFEWEHTGASRQAEPHSLEFFLVERYLLFSTNAQGALFTGQVHHSPYQVHAPRLCNHSMLPMEQAGFHSSAQPASVLAAEAVNVEVFALESA